MIVYILIIILFSLSFFPKIRNHNRLGIINNKLNDFKVTNSILLIWIVFGFLTRFDFNQMWGCVINLGKVLDYNNIGFLTLSFALILTARFIKNKSVINILLLVELGIWLIRYIYYKGGYATGLTGRHPLGIIVLYDSVAIILRLINIKSNSRLKQFKISWILAISIILISIKIFFFSMPHDLFWETKRIQKKTEYTKDLLIGKWTGYVEYDSTWIDTLKIYKLDTISEEQKNTFDFGADMISIDSTHKYVLLNRQKSMLKRTNIEFSSNMIIKTNMINCSMDFYHYNWGDLIQNDSSVYGDFKIRNICQDSLEIILSEGYTNHYKYKLYKNNAW